MIKKEESKFLVIGDSYAPPKCKNPNNCRSGEPGCCLTEEGRKNFWPRMFAEMAKDKHRRII